MTNKERIKRNVAASLFFMGALGSAALSYSIYDIHRSYLDKHSKAVERTENDVKKYGLSNECLEATRKYVLSNTFMSNDPEVVANYNSSCTTKPYEDESYSAVPIVEVVTDVRNEKYYDPELPKRLSGYISALSAAFLISAARTLNKED